MTLETSAMFLARQHVKETALPLRVISGVAGDGDVC